MSGCTVPTVPLYKNKKVFGLIHSFNEMAAYRMSSVHQGKGCFNYRRPQCMKGVCNANTFVFLVD